MSEVRWPRAPWPLRSSDARDKLRQHWSPIAALPERRGSASTTAQEGAVVAHDPLRNERRSYVHEII
jgi:hypothetical protein